MDYIGRNQTHSDVDWAGQVYAADLFKDQVCLVSGGGSGIGEQIALHLAELQGTVWICGRKEDKLKAAVDRMHDRLRQGPSASSFRPVRWCVCDIRQYDAVTSLMRRVVHESGGRLDVLVNNAGGQFASLAEAISPKGFAAVVRNNLIGTWHMTHAAATVAFIPQKLGRIVNITANCDRGFPTMVHTGAARAGVENMTKTLAVEWARFNVTVNAVAPGIIQSTGTLTNYGDESFGRSMLRDAARTLPVQRVGTVSETSLVTLFLASPKASSYVTGVVLHVDGGQRLWGDQFEGCLNRDGDDDVGSVFAANKKQSKL